MGALGDAAWMEKRYKMSWRGNKESQFWPLGLRDVSQEQGTNDLLYKPSRVQVGILGKRNSTGVDHRAVLEELGERGVTHHQYQVTGGPKSRTRRLPRTRTSHPHKGRHPTAAGWRAGSNIWHYPQLLAKEANSSPWLHESLHEHSSES